MNDERKISICIPTFNRPELTISSFIEVYGDERISEIIIVDDASEIHNYDRLKKITDNLPKVKLYRNEENLDCYRNKAKAISYADNRNCILFDSDNTLDKQYIDKVFDVINWGDYVAMLPSFAAPHFNYTKYEGLTITRQNVNHNAADPTFTTMLNTANCFVDRDFYLKCFDHSIDPHTADSIYMNYRMLDAGGSIYVVPGLTYIHRIDDHKGEQGGHYNMNVHKTPPGFHDSIVQKLKDMR